MYTRDHLLETPESPGHLGNLLTMLPTADDLVTRLKPKLIQDPLLDGKGQAFTHQRLFRYVYMCACVCVCGGGWGGGGRGTYIGR